MPRRSSGGRSARARAPARAPAGKTSAPVNHAPPPPPAPVYNSSSGGIGSAIVDGMAFSTGSAIAHRVADAVMGPRTIRTETVTVAEPKPAVTNSPFSNACDLQSKAFQDCINSSGADIGKCQFYMDILTECRKGADLLA